MGEFRKKTGIGDRVQITGLLGEFVVVQLKQHGLAIDFKNLGLLRLDYIEKDIPTSELIYPHPPQTLGPLRY